MSDAAPDRQVAEIVIRADGEIFGDNTPDCHALARRVHACIAACDQIATEELERGIVGEMQSLLQSVRPILESLRTSGRAAA